MIVGVRLLEHARGAEHRHRILEASLVINNEFITANFRILAAPDPYGAHENGHHAAVTLGWTTRTGAAFDEQCDLRLIGPLISFRDPSGFTRRRDGVGFCYIARDASGTVRQDIPHLVPHPWRPETLRLCRRLELVFAM